MMELRALVHEGQPDFFFLSLSPSHFSITEIRDNNNETVPQVSLFCVGLSQHQCA